METLESLREAVSSCVQEPSITDEEIDAILNRGVLEIAGGGTRRFSVPTLPGLPLLSTDFVVATVPGENTADMPATYHRDALYGFNDRYEPIKFYDSLLLMRRNFESSRNESVFCFTVVGNTVYYFGSPATTTNLTIHGFRLPVDMASDNDSPDGLPAHLQYRLLFNYACMEIFGLQEQDMKDVGYNTAKHSALYEQALTDLFSVIDKDEPDQYVQYEE